MKIARRPDYEAHNQFLRSRKEKETEFTIS